MIRFQNKIAFGVLGALMLLAALLYPGNGVSPAFANPYTVDTTSDANLTVCAAAPADCSLRGAINNANANGGADTITFDPGVFPATISLGSALPALSMGGDTIDGSGKGVIVDGVTQSFDCLRLMSNGNTVMGVQVKGCTSGIRVEGAGNTIGGTAGTTPGGPCTGACNVISGNNDGVCVSGAAATGNAIRSNSIFANAALGIDLTAGGDICTQNLVTANDPVDGDTGSNNLQNFPVLTLAVSNGTSTTVQGSLNSNASAPFTIEFFSNPTCDSSGNGEGQTFLGSMSVMTDGSGNTGTFTKGGLPPVTVGQVVTTTATRNAAPLDTSEFSACATVATPSGPDADGDGMPDSIDNCPNWANPTQALPSWPPPTTTAWTPPNTTDPDCDGFPSSVAVPQRASEAFLGTDPSLHCAANKHQRQRAAA